MSLPPLDLTVLREQANAIRALAMDAVERAQSGHPGQPMGMADVATVLFSRHLNFYAAKPEWPNRDRFILSGGHGSMLLYALAYLTGYPGITLDDIQNFRQLGAITAGHPERHLQAGIEMTTGPLGQGLAASVGFALAQARQETLFGPDICAHLTYVMCGDGDLQEGVTHEACALAGHWRLKNLIVLYDDNGISIDGPTALSFTEDACARFNAYGFATRRIDGHDAQAIDDALTWARSQDRPVFIACKTTIGFGAGAKAGTADCHGSPLGPEEIAQARKNLDWPHDPFVIPDHIRARWQDVGMRGRDAYLAWEKSLAALNDEMRQNYIDAQSGVRPHAVETAIHSVTQKFMAAPPAIATRKASQIVLEHLVPALPNLIGGSADLTGSNLTKVTNDKNYIHYGVREHGMAAIMNGLALHGGFVPYGGTFLCFADYARPAIRLAALMGIQVIYVMTHDSIGLGEDGPTHQPIEHLASLRAIPNVRVFRPADATETAYCWELALKHRTGPSILCLTRQNVRPLPADRRMINGAHVVLDTPNPRVVIYATGSEVEIALDTAQKLDASNIRVRVISIPSFEILREQGSIQRDSDVLSVGIEAGIRQGWDDIIGPGGLFFGLSTFGASGPAKKLYDHFGLTAEKISKKIIAALNP